MPAFNLAETPGAFIAEEITITSTDGETVDLSNFAVEFNLYEDLFSPVLNGNVIIVDSGGLIDKLPIVGNEILSIEFKTSSYSDADGDVFRRSFQVYAIENRALNNDKEEIYKLSFISREGYADQLITLNQSFSGNTSDIAGTLFSYISGIRYLKSSNNTELRVLDSPHSSNIKFVSNNWSPIKCLHFVGKRVIANSSPISDCLFFETNKSFYFGGISSLVESQLDNKTVLDDYVYEQEGSNIPRRADNFNYHGRILPPEWTRIQQITALKTVNILEGQEYGYYSNSVRGYDFYSKKMHEIVFDIASDVYNTGPLTSRGVPIPKNITSNPYLNEQFYPFNPILFNTYGPSADNYGNLITVRKSYLNSFDQFKFKITIPGRTDIEAGMLINMKYPIGASREDGNDGLNQLFSGPYIIMAMHHKFSMSTRVHTIIAEVSRNGLDRSIR